MGEHYNSVRRGDDDMKNNNAPISEFPIGYDLWKVQEMLSGQDLDLEIKELEDRPQDEKGREM